VENLASEVTEKASAKAIYMYIKFCVEGQASN
jgi:hypothetical protein